jgi:CBS domain-containing protein
MNFMQIGEVCVRDVVSADRSTSVQEAAGLMRSHHVGTVVVVDRGAKGAVPVGIVTDRDIVIEILAAQLDASQLTVGDIMGPDLITAPEDQDVFETVQQMQRHGVRRLPVVDRHGVLIGITTVDDLVEFLGMHLSALAKVSATERKREIEARP